MRDAIAHIRAVKWTARVIVLGWLVLDFLAHLSNLVNLGFDPGLSSAYGTVEYEMTGAIVLGFMATMWMVALVAASLERSLVQEDVHDGD